jgi:hypothetical protein
MPKKRSTGKATAAKAATLIGAIPAISPGSLISAAVQRQRPPPFVRPKGKKGKR